MPEGREALLQALGRLQPRARRSRRVRDRMTDYEAMRIDRDRDPIVTDVVMRRYLDTGEIQQDTASPGNPALPQSGEVEGWRGQVQSARGRASTRGRPPGTSRPSASSERALEALAAERGRKSLVFASGGMIQDPRLGHLPAGGERGAARERGRLLPRRARAHRRDRRAWTAEVGTRTEFRDLGSWFTESRERGEGS